MELREMFKKEDIEKFHIPRWEELPEIDLYLDQVVSFIDKYLLYYLNAYSNQKDDKKEKIVKIEKKEKEQKIKFLFELIEMN